MGYDHLAGNGGREYIGMQVSCDPPSICPTIVIPKHCVCSSSVWRQEAPGLTAYPTEREGDKEKNLLFIDDTRFHVSVAREPSRDKK